MFEAIFSLNTLWWVCTFIWFPACALLIVIVLMQKGKGAGFAGAFGVGGGSDAVFGPRSRKSLPVRLTYIAAGMFMFLSLVLSLIVGRINAGVAPEAVDENAAASSAMNDLFGGTPSTEAPAAAPATAEGASAPAAPAAAPEAAPAAGAEQAPAPAESAPAPAPAGQ